MTADFAGDSYRVVKGLFTQIVNEGRFVKISCNWCIDDDGASLFFEGPTVRMHKQDWLAAAILHLTSEHPEVMRE